MTRALLAVLVAWGAIGGLQVPAAHDQQVVREAYLMGTRVRLAIYATSREAGMSMLDTALRVLESTEREISTWRADSDLSTLNRAPVGVPWRVPDATCRMLRGAYHWYRETAGAFDPEVGAARAGPDVARLTFDEASCMATRSAGAAIDAGGFGKGEALDRVEAILGAQPWLVDLGGQLSAGGPQPDGSPWLVDIAHPVHRDAPHVQAVLRQGSLSTSGRSERGDHIVDARTGRPAAFRGSVTVWHRQGLAADALSTALYVMGPEQGLAWAEARDIAAMFLLPEGGGVRTLATSAWTRRR